MSQIQFSPTQLLQFLLGLGVIITGLSFIKQPFVLGPHPPPAGGLPSKGEEIVSTSTLLTFAIDRSAVSSTVRSPYQLLIPKIGVDMPIILNESSERRGLAQGAWHIPGSAVPGQPNAYNNTVISAHRYLYTSGPHTFFNLDKLAPGDEIIVTSPEGGLQYVVIEKKVVAPNAVDILQPTNEPVLTLFTCHPAFSTKERLVIRALPKGLDTIGLDPTPTSP